jgi:hypothetical protein
MQLLHRSTVETKFWSQQQHACAFASTEHGGTVGESFGWSHPSRVGLSCLVLGSGLKMVTSEDAWIKRLGMGESGSGSSRLVLCFFEHSFPDDGTSNPFANARARGSRSGLDKSTAGSLLRRERPAGGATR